MHRGWVNVAGEPLGGVVAALVVGCAGLGPPGPQDGPPGPQGPAPNPGAFVPTPLEVVVQMYILYLWRIATEE